MPSHLPQTPAPWLFCHFTCHRHFSVWASGMKLKGTKGCSWVLLWGTGCCGHKGLTEEGWLQVWGREERTSTGQNKEGRVHLVEPWEASEALGRNSKCKLRPMFTPSWVQGPTRLRSLKMPWEVYYTQFFSKKHYGLTEALFLPSSYQRINSSTQQWFHWFQSEFSFFKKKKSKK